MTTSKRKRSPAAARVLPTPLVVVAMLTPVAADGFDPLRQLAAYDVVWRSPGEDYRATMPIGNGEIGLNVWWERGGDLQFFIARTDAWDEIGRLVKVGKVRVSLDPNPAAIGRHFRQTLRLASGTIEFVLSGGDEEASVALWVDAHHPVVHITVDSARPLDVTAQAELWRTARQQIDYAAGAYFGDPPYRVPIPAFVGPDTIVAGDRWKPDAAPDRIGWYHHNGKSEWYEITARLQGLEGFGGHDPLERRTFGAMITAEGGRRIDDRTLRSPRGTSHHLSVFTHTQQPSSPRAWIEAIEALRADVRSAPLASRRQDHVRWWNDFWRRSWIFVGETTAPTGERVIERNDHPVRVGVDQIGGNRFSGEIARVGVSARGMSDAEVADLARSGPTEKARDAPGRWLISIREPGTTLEASRDLEIGQALSVEAWIRPGRLPPGGGRIVDKITPGGDDGFLLDTFPGNSLRFITTAGTLSHADCLRADRWSHVAAVADRRRGILRLFLDGEVLAETTLDADAPATAVTRGYILQRWITACAGRGTLPIKFNGSLFTVPHPDGWNGDPDYRRWGSGYWWQNTRLPYISACTSGDFELMRPLFAMYTGEHLEVAKYRNRHHLGSPGAFYNECVYFWGHAFNECYGLERPADLPEGINLSGWHRHEFTAGYELLHMMLDFHEHTLDGEFLATTLIPFAREILTFFDTRYGTDAEGKIVIHAAQALETWWDCTNPMPDVAGLRSVTARLLALPPGGLDGEDIALWRRLRAKLPALPTRQADGTRLLAPAEEFAQKRNIENPELYAVFPFRLVAVGRPDIELGLEALRRRPDRGNSGWRQDEIFMAYLGLAEEARENLVGRARSSHPGSRFPAFWGPNYDWVPDQDHGGVLMKALQAMLLQTEGRRIYLLPAWPGDWSADFRLHAPFRTVLQGRVENGRISHLQVDPPERRRDVILP